MQKGLGKFIERNKGILYLCPSFLKNFTNEISFFERQIFSFFLTD